MSNSDAPPSDALSHAAIVVQPHTLTLRGPGFERQITMGECLEDQSPLPGLLFAQVLLLSDMSRALQSMDATFKASASGVEGHKASAQKTLEETLDRVVGFMSSIPGMDQTVVQQMTNALKPTPSGGTPS